MKFIKPVIRGGGRRPKEITVIIFRISGHWPGIKPVTIRKKKRKCIGARPSKYSFQNCCNVLCYILNRKHINEKFLEYIEHN
jgi:hypothetical protein